VEGLAVVFAGQRPLRVPQLIVSRTRARALLALFGGVLAVAPAACAENRWTLWERPVDLNSPATGEWRRTQTFEAQRWCKGAMTTAINQNLLAGWKGGRLDPKAKITEYQCVPEGERPPE
jgi:hypothetical protein